MGTQAPIAHRLDTAPPRSTKMCFVPAKPADVARRHLLPSNNTPLTFSPSYLELFGCHTTLSGFPPFFPQLVTVSPRVRNASRIARALTFGGIRARSGSNPKCPRAFLREATWKFDRKLRARLAALCSCWRDEIIPGSLPLALQPRESRENASWGKQNVTVATVAHLWWDNTDEAMGRGLTLSKKEK